MPDSDPSSILTAIRERAAAVAEPTGDGILFIKRLQDSAADVPRLLAAFEVALAHHPQSIEIGVTGEAGPHCARCRTAWPCPEAQAITSALTGQEAGDARE